MKAGLLIYKAKNTFKNIGDYIQSIAAEQYTGRDVTFIEREHLHEYAGEPIKLIMNGWFMHIPENWPPSKDIVPLFTSFHINPSKGKKMLSEKGIAYLKTHGPVGCRDRGTERLLTSKGIPAYFSGCLTLTLGKTYTHNPKGEKVYFVDPYFEEKLSRNLAEVLKNTFTLLAKWKIIQKICCKLQENNSLRHLLKTTTFFRIYSKAFEEDVLANAEYVKHMVLESKFESEESKFAYAKTLLSNYANAKLVVTSRIHAALPCLAMGTPVIFIISDDLQPNGKGLQPGAKGRFDGLMNLFHVMELLNNKLKPILGFKLEKKIGLDHNINNKQDHIKMAEDMDQRCTLFMKIPVEGKIETAY